MMQMHLSFYMFLLDLLVSDFLPCSNLSLSLQIDMDNMGKLDIASILDWDRRSNKVEC